MSYMKLEFDKILKQYGHNIYLNRRVRAQGATDGSYENKFEIHTVRYDAAGDLSADEEHMEGTVNTSERIYYFRSEAKPFEGDRLYEDDPRVDQTVWEIDTTVPMRGLNGEIEFYKAGVSRIRPN